MYNFLDICSYSFKQNYPPNPSGIQIFCMLIREWVSAGCSRYHFYWFTDLYVFARVCLWVVVVYARFNPSDIFYPEFPFRNRKKGSANHLKSANLQTWMKDCSVSNNDENICTLIGTFHLHYTYCFISWIIGQKHVLIYFANV